MKNLITSVQHPEVKFVKALSRRKTRREHGLFVIEGLRFVEEAVKAGAPLVKVYYTSQVLETERGMQLINELIAQRVTMQEVALTVLEKMADTEQPQGILATVRMTEPALEALPNTQTLIVVCDKIQDPGNLGTIMRTADAAGVHAVFTTMGTVDVYNPKVLRSTMGAIFRVPVFTEMEPENIIDWLAERNITPIGTGLTARQTHFAADYCRSVAIWLGSEAAGIEESIAARLPEVVKIPMPGQAESLNVAVAAGILMFECVRQRMAPPAAAKQG